MNDKGQVYFDAGDQEIPDEDKARYEEARTTLDEIKEHFRRESEERQRCDRLGTARQRKHIEQRTARKAAEQAQAEAYHRAQEQKDE